MRERRFGNLPCRCLPALIVVCLSSLATAQQDEPGSIRLHLAVEQGAGEGPGTLWVPVGDDEETIDSNTGLMVVERGTPPVPHVLVYRAAERLAPTDLAGLRPSHDPGGNRSIVVDLHPPAAARMQTLTANHIGRTLVVVVDGQVIMAATIQSTFGRTFEITGRDGVSAATADALFGMLGQLTPPAFHAAAPPAAAPATATGASASVVAISRGITMFALAILAGLVLLLIVGGVIVAIAFGRRPDER
jgi:hypothetical protein